MRLLPSIAIAAALSTLTLRAEADEARGRSYAVQTVAVDALGLATTTAGVLFMLNGSEEAANVALFTGAGAFTIGAPIVHLAHGEASSAGISLVLRLGGIAFGATAGFLVGLAGGSGCGGHDDPTGWSGLCVLGYGAVGAGVGAGTAMIAVSAIDALVLAREHEPTRATGATVFPTIGVQRSGAGVGLAGSF